MLFLRSLLIVYTILLSLHGGEILIYPDTKEKNITPFVKYFIDETGGYDEETVQNRNDLFKTSAKEKLLLGYRYDSVLWIKFSLYNPTDKTIVKYIEYDYPIQEYFTLYDLTEKKSYEGGYLAPNRDRRFYTFPVKIVLKPSQKKDFLIRATDKNIGMIAKLNVTDLQTLLKKSDQADKLNFLFLGSIVALLVYNMFLLLLTRDVTYFYYILMMSTFLILELFMSGFLAKYIENFYVSRIDIYILLLVMAFSLAMFTSSFLDLPNRYPDMQRVIHYLLIFLVMLFLLNITDVVPTLAQRVLYMMSFSILIYIGVYAYKNGSKQAGYYIFGWALLLCSAVLMATHQAGLLDWYDKIPHIGKFSIFAEGILFSMALSARINTLKNEKEKAIQMLLKERKKEQEKLENYAREKTKELKLAIDEKTMLLKELHHRVKNNLQIVISLLRLQSDKFDNHEINEILTKSENRIKAISSVHELLYKSDSIIEIDMQHYFESLSKDISDSFSKEVDIKVDSRVKMGMDKAIYCGLILNELLTNSLKYAFEKSGEIRVNLVHIDHSYTLTIQDNGKGFDIKATKSGLGMQLVKTLVTKQLKGRMRIECNGGTKYIISF